MDNTIRITNIQHFSVHDGPGVRTTVFTKGCNLKCQWCHNPETIQAKPQISYNEELCIGCGMCTQICPEHHRFLNMGVSFMGLCWATIDILKKRCFLPEGIIGRP